MGMLKRRVWPEDVIINCSKDSKKPSPPDGHKWKEIRHDNTVNIGSSNTWILCRFSRAKVGGSINFCRLLGWPVGRKTCKGK